MIPHTHTHFYSHLASLDPVIVELQHLDMSNDEFNELVTIIHSHLHDTIIDVVLSRLSGDDKKEFLKHIENNNHAITWKFLEEKTEHIEETLKIAAENLMKELIKDIDELKKKEKVHEVPA